MVLTSCDRGTANSASQCVRIAAAHRLHRLERLFPEPGGVLLVDPPDSVVNPSFASITLAQAAEQEDSSFASALLLLPSSTFLVFHLHKP